MKSIASTASLMHAAPLMAGHSGLFQLRWQVKEALPGDDGAESDYLLKSLQTTCKTGESWSSDVRASFDVRACSPVMYVVCCWML